MTLVTTCWPASTPVPEGNLWGFTEALDRWIAVEAPGGRLRRDVTSWVLSRFDDPYVGVRRETEFPNLWWGAVPGSHEDGTVVVCSYFVEEASRTVRCDTIATLNEPV